MPQAPTQPAELEVSAPDAIDPELVALPAPPRGRRFAAMTLMALTVAASFGLLSSLRADVGYFFAAERAVDLGEVTGVVAADLTPNSFVHVQGTPMASGMVRYQRLFSGARTVFPLAGQRTIFVDMALAGPDAERNLSQRQFAGRLVTFGQLGSRFSDVRGYLQHSMGAPVSSESFLLLVDEPPGRLGWSVIFAVLCALFIVLNIVLLLRWFRPLPTAVAD